LESLALRFVQAQTPSATMSMEVPPPPPPTSSVPPAPPPAEDAPPAARPQEPSLPDPGPYTDLHREARGVFSYPYTFFEGIKLAFMRGVSQNMQVSHTINLGGSQPPGYHFAPTYVGDYKPDPEDNQQFPVCISDVDHEGNLRAQIIHSFNKRLSATFNGQSKPRGEWQGAESSLHYVGDDWQANLTAVNPKPSTQEGIMVMSYLQKISTHFAAGGEFLYQGQGGHVNTAISLAARYRCPDFVACASLAMHQIGLSYYAPIDAKTKVATELDINLVQGDATATFGYAVQMRTASVKAQFDTKGQVACGIEQELLGPAFVLMLNGIHDHMSTESKLGVGLRMST